jgi:hypothetical protein
MPVAQRLEPWQQFLATRRIERGHWFVEQQQPWPGQERASECHALALPTGELVRPAAQQSAETEQLHRVGELRLGAAGARAALPVAQIAGNVEMGKQERVLEDVADPSLLRRQRVTLRGVVERGAVERDATAIRAQQPRNQVYHRGLATAGTAEEGRHARCRRCECGFEVEVAAAQTDVDFEHASTPDASPQYAG